MVVRYDHQLMPCCHGCLVFHCSN